MGMRDDIRIGKLYPPERDLPGPNSPVPEGCERVRTSARTWRVFRQATAFELKYGRVLVYSIHDEPDPDRRRVMEEEGARPTSLIPVHQPSTPDPLHGLQLLRDLKLINERTVNELGPLPKGGLPVQEKRKPMPYGAHMPVLAHEPSLATNAGSEDDTMKLRHLAAAAALSASTLAGCTDPNHPRRNPHPTQRYEVTVTTDAPGPWDNVKAAVSYEVTNLECTPENTFIGVHTGVPMDQWEDIQITQVSENTWRGYFYRDLLKDEDYYGLGICHWDGTQVSPNFFVHGVRFSTGQWVNEALKKPQTRFFRKSDFLNRSVDPDAVRNFSDRDPVVRQSDDFFSIAVTVKEAKP
jgi:hypothetical protein